MFPAVKQNSGYLPSHVRAKLTGECVDTSEDTRCHRCIKKGFDCGPRILPENDDQPREAVKVHRIVPPHMQAQVLQWRRAGFSESNIYALLDCTDHCDRVNREG